MADHHCESQLDPLSLLLFSQRRERLEIFASRPYRHPFGQRKRGGDSARLGSEREGEMRYRLLDLRRLGPCLAVVAAMVLLCGSSIIAPAQGDSLPKIGYLGLAPPLRDLFPAECGHKSFGAHLNPFVAVPIPRT